jgi:hypothetical protein
MTPLLLLLGILCPSSSQDGTSVSIDHLPFTIGAPGRYLVASDLTGVKGMDGVRVEADDVILDLGGHTLTGVLGSASGIRTIGERRNVTVLRGEVARWGGDGVSFAGSIECRVRGVSALNNGGHGIHLGDRGEAIDCAVQLNHGGRGLFAGREARVVEVRANGNEFGGIEVGFGSTVFQCLAVGNLSTHGIATGGKSLVRNCTAMENHGSGFDVGGGSLVIECGAFDNIDHGMRVAGDSLVAGCESTGSVDGHGLLVGRASLVSNSIFKNNRHLGVRAGPEVVVSACEISGNRRGGLVVAGEGRLFGNRLDGDMVLEGGGVADRNVLFGNARILARHVPAILVRNEAAALEFVEGSLIGPILPPLSADATQVSEENVGPWVNRVPME